MVEHYKIISALPIEVQLEHLAGLEYFLLSMHGKVDLKELNFIKEQREQLTASKTFFSKRELEIADKNGLVRGAGGAEAPWSFYLKDKKFMKENPGVFPINGIRLGNPAVGQASDEWYINRLGVGGNESLTRWDSRVLQEGPDDIFLLDWPGRLPKGQWQRKTSILSKVFKQKFKDTSVLLPTPNIDYIQKYAQIKERTFLRLSMSEKPDSRKAFKQGTLPILENFSPRKSLPLKRQKLEFLPGAEKIQPNSSLPPKKEDKNSLQGELSASEVYEVSSPSNGSRSLGVPRDEKDLENSEYYGYVTTSETSNEEYCDNSEYSVDTSQRYARLSAPGRAYLDEIDNLQKKISETGAQISNLRKENNLRRNKLNLSEKMFGAPEAQKLLGAPEAKKLLGTPKDLLRSAETNAKWEDHLRNSTTIIKGKNAPDKTTRIERKVDIKKVVVLKTESKKKDK